MANHSSRLRTCLETLEAYIRSGVFNAISLAEGTVDEFANREPDLIRRIDALDDLRKGVENMAVNGARLGTANEVLAHIDKKLRELQRDN